MNLSVSGFNDSNPSRLCLSNAPITQTTYKEAFDIYAFARNRNIYPIVALSMVSGKQFSKQFIKEVDITTEQKIELFTRIYSWNIEQGLQTLEQIEQESVSAMPGSHPCNQLACGLYLSANGNLVSCPGFTEIEGNVR